MQLKQNLIEAPVIANTTDTKDAWEAQTKNWWENQIQTWDNWTVAVGSL